MLTSQGSDADTFMLHEATLLCVSAEIRLQTLEPDRKCRPSGVYHRDCSTEGWHKRLCQSSSSYRHAGFQESASSQEHHGHPCKVIYLRLQELSRSAKDVMKLHPRGTLPGRHLDMNVMEDDRTVELQLGEALSGLLPGSQWQPLSSLTWSA
jgi:hypothetical protein